MKYLPLLILRNFVVECIHNGTNVVSMPSGTTSNVRKLCVAYGETDEADVVNRSFYRI
jgi:hypothetical protein